MDDKNSGIVATSPWIDKLKDVPLAFKSLKVENVPKVYFNIEEDDLKSSVKKKSVVEAKSAFGYLAIKKMGYSGREVGSFLNMRSYSAIRRAQEGKKVIDKREFQWSNPEIVE